MKRASLGTSFQVETLFMRTSEARTSVRSTGHSTVKGLDGLGRLGRKIPSKVRRQLAAQPEATLAAIAGVSFLAGVTLGSRLGRALVSVMIPIALERLVPEDWGHRLMKYATELWTETANARHTVPARGGS
jgi:hypothetical protein